MVRVESNNSGAESDEEHSENPKSSCISKYTVTASKGFTKLNDRLLSVGKPKSSLLAFDSDKKEPGLISKKANSIEEAQRTSDLYKGGNSSSSSFLSKPENSLGRGWFDLAPMKLDEKLKRDIKAIQMRNYMDPKRFYKNPDKLGKILHTGTIIEGPSEYKSGRLTNRERKQTIMEEILADGAIKDYTKRKFQEIQVTKNNKQRMYKKSKSDKKQKKVRALF